MGVAMNAISKFNAALGGAAMTASHITSKADKQKEKNTTGKDMKMAAKARKNYQEKINAIYANKELSAKARTRRIGKLLDEYEKGGK